MAQKKTTLQILQTLQVQDAINAINWINWIQTTLDGLYFPPSISEEERFAVRWHCTRQYVIVVLDIPEPTPEFIREMYRTLYEGNKSSKIEVRAYELEQEVDRMVEAIRDLISEIN